MLSLNGLIFKRFAPLVLFLLLISSQRANSQRVILDSLFTFREGSVKTGIALDIISKKSGYNFTYDSRLINGEKKTILTFNNIKLSAILDSILRNDSLVFSVINKYIIISRAERVRVIKSDTSSVTNLNYITGVIKDDETLEPLSFATLALKNKGKGTVTNANGEFGLKITPDLVTDTLSVSYLGYLVREIPVRQALGNNFTILMKREFISIPEIIIKNQIPQEIISKARYSIPHNFGDSPVLMTAFYREGVMKKRELQTYSEAVLQIYKSAYSGTLYNDQIKVYKSRKIENSDRKDTLSLRLKAGLSSCLDLDGAKNIFDFLAPERMSDYNYRITDIVTYEDESAYVIEFEQREDIEIPLFKGTIYINTADFGILHADFELNNALVHKMKDFLVSNRTRGFNTMPESVKYSVSYRKMNNRYFLSHVRGDLVFSSSKKKKLFKTQFNVFLELAITDINLKNATRFDREELAPIHAIFSKTITSYDPQFWGDQDFLRPEDNLLQALKNMNVKLHEFSK